MDQAALSNATLTKCNLRAAVLTDADLLATTCKVLLEGPQSLPQD
ncbi:pentapeptide repeat-containing protein [Nocardioides sp. GXZ039]